MKTVVKGREEDEYLCEEEMNEWKQGGLRIKKGVEVDDIIA